MTAPASVSMLLLRNVPLFSTLPEHQLALLTGVVSRKSFPRGTSIIAAGDITESLFVVISGRLKVMMSDDEGREVILAILGPNEFFGEMGLIDDHPRSASVVAIEACELLTLSKRDFKSCLAENFEMAMTVMRGLVKRLREADQKIGSLALMDVYGRVARLLLEMAETVNGQKVVTKKLAKQDIAKMIGASREMVSRVMKDLQSGGFIDVRPGCGGPLSFPRPHHVQPGRPGLVAQRSRGRSAQPRREGGRLDSRYAAVSVRRIGLVVGRAPGVRRDLDLSALGGKLERRPALVRHRSHRLCGPAARLKRLRGLAPSFIEDIAPPRARRAARRPRGESAAVGIRFHRCHSDPAHALRDDAVPVHRALMVCRHGEAGDGAGVLVPLDAREIAGLAGQKSRGNRRGQARGGGGGEARAADRGSPADPDRTPRGGNSEILQSAEGEAGAAVPRAARHAAASHQAAR